MISDKDGPATADGAPRPPRRVHQVGEIHQGGSRHVHRNCKPCYNTGIY